MTVLEFRRPLLDNRNTVGRPPAYTHDTDKIDPKTRVFGSGYTKGAA